MKLKVNPLFFAFTLILVLMGQGIKLMLSILALLLHEAGHLLVARVRGYVMKNASLMPFGAMMSTEGRFDKTSGVLIGLAGPFANLAVALLTLGVWWLFPSIYGVTRFFLFANLSLALFNLLPVYPLDGSRVALALAKNKLRAIKWLKGLGIAVSVLFFGGFIATLFFKVNFSLGIIAVFLFYGAAFGTKDETYLHVLSVQSKNFAVGVELKTVMISAHAPLIRYFHHVGRTSETTFKIVDDNGALIKTLSEKELKLLAAQNKLSKSFSDIRK